MAAPSLPQKFLYLCAKRAPEEHHGWIEDILAGDERRAGMMLAIPNAVVMLGFAVLSVFVGGAAYAVFLAAAALVLLVLGFTVPALSRRRADKIAAANGLRSP